MTRVRTAVAALLAACAAAGADEPKTADPKKAPARLDFKALGEMLTDMGYEPKATDNDTFHKITATGKGTGYPVWVSVSSNKQFVRLYTSFDLPPGFEKAPAESWRKLMEKNDDIAPAVFAVNESDRRLVLRRPVPNDDLTPAQFRKAINAYVDVIEQSKGLWARANFLPEMTPEAKKVLAGLAGTWKLTEGAAAGKPVPADQLAKFTFVIDGRTLTVTAEGQATVTGALNLQIKSGAVWFDLDTATGTDLGILKVAGDALTMCMGSERPTEFVSTEKAKSALFVLKRQKK
jgi:uncharacterized protein (TIGR03067 family)